MLNLQDDVIFNTLINLTIKETISLLNDFDLNVPHKFVSPRLGSGNKTEIYN
jgi:hypothetical protein